MASYELLFCYSLLTVLFLARASNAKSLIIRNGTDIGIDSSRAKRSSGFIAKGEFLAFWNSDSDIHSDIDMDSGNGIDRDSDNDIGSHTDIDSSSSGSSDNLQSMLEGLTKPRHLSAKYQSPDGATQHGSRLSHHRCKRDEKHCPRDRAAFYTIDEQIYPTVNQLFRHPSKYCWHGNVEITPPPLCHDCEGDRVLTLSLDETVGFLGVSNEGNPKHDLLIVVIPRDLSTTTDSKGIPEMLKVYSIPLRYDKSQPPVLKPLHRHVSIEFSSEFQKFVKAKTTKLKIRLYHGFEDETGQQNAYAVCKLSKLKVPVEVGDSDECARRRNVNFKWPRLQRGGYERFK